MTFVMLIQNAMALARGIDTASLSQRHADAMRSYALRCFMARHLVHRPPGLLRQPSQQQLLMEEQQSETASAKDVEPRQADGEWNHWGLPVAYWKKCNRLTASVFELNSPSLKSAGHMNSQKVVFHC